MKMLMIAQPRYNESIALGTGLISVRSFIETLFSLACPSYKHDWTINSKLENGLSTDKLNRTSSGLNFRQNKWKIGLRPGT